MFLPLDIVKWRFAGEKKKTIWIYGESHVHHGKIPSWKLHSGKPLCRLATCSHVTTLSAIVGLFAEVGFGCSSTTATRTILSKCCKSLEPRRPPHLIAIADLSFRTGEDLWLRAVCRRCPLLLGSASTASLRERRGGAAKFRRLRSKSENMSCSTPHLPPPPSCLLGLSSSKLCALLSFVGSVGLEQLIWTLLLGHISHFPV